MRKAVWILAALLAATASPKPADAGGACRGSISGSPLRQIVKPVVVSVAGRTTSVADPDLTRQFAAGMEHGGVSVAPEGQGTTVLDLSYLVQGVQKGTYRDLTWLKAASSRNQDRMTLQGSRLGVTIYARDAASRSLVWTGTIDCTIQTSDPNTLANDLGTAVGRSLGHFVPKEAL